MRVAGGAIFISPLLLRRSTCDLVLRCVVWNSLSERSEKIVTPNTALRFAARSFVLSLSIVRSVATNMANLSLSSEIDEYCANTVLDRTWSVSPSASEVEMD